jgi:hypothetical protein
VGLLLKLKTVISGKGDGNIPVTKKGLRPLILPKNETGEIIEDTDSDLTVDEGARLQRSISYFYSKRRDGQKPVP